MRILVTGAAGFIGSHLLRRLAPAHDVWGLSRRSPTPGGADGISWLVHDLTRMDLPTGLPSNLDAVIHMAQSRHFRNFAHHADDIVSVNVRGTLTALEWARALGAARFIYLSTGGIGGASASPITETAQPEPAGSLAVYLASKGAAELLVKSYGSFLAPVVLRPFFVYGPGQDPSMLIPRLINRIRAGQPIVVRPPDGIRINPVHVDDAVTAIARALEIDAPAVVNVAGPDVITIGEIARLIGAALNVRPRLEVALDSSDGDMIGDTRAMTALLGAPKIRFRDGIAKLCAHRPTVPALDGSV